MEQRVLVLTAACVTGCYAEVGIGYYPTIHETIETGPSVTSTAKTSGYVGMIKLGFYLDVPLASLKSAVGAGLCPGVGGDGVSPSNAPAKVGTEGIEGRVDVALPYFLSVFQPRVTMAYLGVVDANVTTMSNAGPVKANASGHTVFLGGSLGATTSGSLIMLSVGLQQQHASTDAAVTSDGAVGPVSISAVGAAARLMVTWTPTGAFMKSYTPSQVSKQCSYGTPVCDLKGHCESHYGCQ